VTRSKADHRDNRNYLERGDGMPKTQRVMVGAAVLSGLFRGECCENCKHCVRKCEIDSSWEYACARLSKSPNPARVRKFDDWRKPEIEAQADRYELWWTDHAVMAGTMCQFYKRKRISVQYVADSTDLTRERELKVN